MTSAAAAGSAAAVPAAPAARAAAAAPMDVVVEQHEHKELLSDLQQASAEHKAREASKRLKWTNKISLVAKALRVCTSARLEHVRVLECLTRDAVQNNCGKKLSGYKQRLLKAEARKQVPQITFTMLEQLTGMPVSTFADYVKVLQTRGYSMYPGRPQPWSEAALCEFVKDVRSNLYTEENGITKAQRLQAEAAREKSKSRSRTTRSSEAKKDELQAKKGARAYLQPMARVFMLSFLLQSIKLSEHGCVSITFVQKKMHELRKHHGSSGNKPTIRTVKKFLKQHNKYLKLGSNGNIQHQNYARQKAGGFICMRQWLELLNDNILDKIELAGVFCLDETSLGSAKSEKSAMKRNNSKFVGAVGQPIIQTKVYKPSSKITLLCGPSVVLITNQDGTQTFRASSEPATALMIQCRQDSIVLPESAAADVPFLRMACNLKGSMNQDLFNKTLRTAAVESADRIRREAKRPDDYVVLMVIRACSSNAAVLFDCALTIIVLFPTLFTWFVLDGLAQKPQGDVCNAALFA
jgi:hypothetical protein